MNLIRVTATAASEEQAWELVATKLRAAFRLTCWHDDDDALELLLDRLRGWRP